MMLRCFNGAIRSEMAIFLHLIKRPEPRNLIQSMFLGKPEYDRKNRSGTIPEFAHQVVSAVRAAVSANEHRQQALASVRTADPQAADHIAAYCANASAAAGTATCRRDEKEAWTRLRAKEGLIIRRQGAVQLRDRAIVSRSAVNDEYLRLRPDLAEDRGRGKAQHDRGDQRRSDIRT